MSAKVEVAVATAPEAAAGASALGILLALSLSHFLNDTIQALIPAIYPLLKDSFRLSFTQIGLITLTFQVTGSIFQPLVGLYTDKHPKPYSLVVGMAFSLGGLVLLALASRYEMILAGAALVGLGSAVFHPESSRMARLASGGRHGFAQSVFQVGGNLGSSLGPLLAAWIIVPRGQRYILVFCGVAFVGMFVLSRVGRWYAQKLSARTMAAHAVKTAEQHPRKLIVLSVAVLLVLIFSKFIYLASMTSYYTFYLIHKFGVTVQASQVYLFVFLFAVAAGTMAGGPIGDRIGRKAVIWVSIFGMSPFSLLLPHANLWGTVTLSVAIGFIMASAFPAILVYAMELLPGKVGLIGGLFFGLAFGTAGIGSALLGKLADRTSIFFVMSVCAFLPLIGLLTGFLPNLKKKRV